MESVLQQINKIPGILGSFVCEGDGRLLAKALPASYDTERLQEAAGILSDSIDGIKNNMGGFVALDLRYSDARILVKPIQKGFILLLCRQQINLALLNMPVEVAIKKMEKCILGQSQLGNIMDVKSSVSGAMQELRRDGKGVVLTVDSMKASSSIPWDQMKEEAAICRSLARELCTAFRTDSIKKLKLTNKPYSRSKVFHMTVYERDSGQIMDNKIALTLAASEVLTAKPGDELTVELASGGMFG